MSSISCIVLLSFALFSLAFVIEGRLFDPTTTGDELSSSESERISIDVTSSKCELPPFLPPFVLSDLEAFEDVSSCPFLLHRQVTGKDIDGCFPMYNIPDWDNSNSVPSEIYEINGRARTPLVFEKKSTFMSWEDFNIVSASNVLHLGECIASLNYKVEGFNGEISGGNGAANLSAIVISFKEHGKENAILLPVGGCKGHSRQLVSHENIVLNNSGDHAGRRAFEESCSIQPNGIERNECFEKCYKSIKSNNIDEIEKLIVNRDKRISKNYENKETVLEKLLITRTIRLSTAFARCKCKHIKQDLGQCLLRIFLDSLVVENEHQFEVEGNFDRHMDEVQIWFQDNRKVICDASASAAVRCYDEC